MAFPGLFLDFLFSVFIGTSQLIRLQCLNDDRKLERTRIVIKKNPNAQREKINGIWTRPARTESRRSAACATTTANEINPYFKYERLRPNGRVFLSRRVLKFF